MRKWVRLTPILLVALLAVSCQRHARQTVTLTPVQPSSTAAAAPLSSGSAPTAEPTSQPAPTAGSPAALPGAPPAPGSRGKQGAITLAPQGPAQPAAPQVSNAPATTLLASAPSGRILPEDFKIGPLGDTPGARKEQKDAVAAAEAFLAALTARKVDAKLLTVEAQATVADSLAYGLTHGQIPSSYRISEPRTRDDGEVTAAVRLFGGQGATEGEIYLTRTGDQWLVSDIQISLAGLVAKRETPKEKFFPSAYRWLLED